MEMCIRDRIDIDQRKAQALGVAIDDINDTLQTAWGSSYVNDFMDRGRVKKVYVQAAAPYRMLPDDINPVSYTHLGRGRAGAVRT